ncbi:DUF3298 and DUF4163 domain-containing protein [Flavobacterium sp. RHBU_3]|uniref:DUF3298 and DUF4163 domain-containing protein n=1 Tax=Flavobacterium sp. RHBU_3 TaxID=3391184 RepID=UPI00398520AA
MKRIIIAAALLATLASCKNEKQETDTENNVDTTAVSTTETAAVSFDKKVYEKKSALNTKDPHTSVTIDVPEATGTGADSINNKIFRTVREIVHFGENPSDAKSYEEVMASFIGAYEELAKKYPDEDVPWDAKVTGEVVYKTDSIVNVKLTHYTFTGGAHGYGADTSLLFDAKTGRSITQNDLFKDKKGFTALAEKKFRAKYKIAGANINSTGLFFLNDRFSLPNNIFFTDKGILLQYNSDEVAAHAEGTKDVLITYAEAKPFLK